MDAEARVDINADVRRERRREAAVTLLVFAPCPTATTAPPVYPIVGCSSSGVGGGGEAKLRDEGNDAILRIRSD